MEGCGEPDAGPVQSLRSPDAPGLSAWLPQLMDVLSAGCSPPSPFSSSPPLEASLISALRSTHLSSLSSSSLSPCAAVISPSPSLFSSLVPVPPVLPSSCCFSYTSTAIGRLFVCTNPCLAAVTPVISELSHTHRPPICGSAPPTSLVISTFDRMRLQAATAVDYRAGSHLAPSVNAYFHCVRR